MTLYNGRTALNARLSNNSDRALAQGHDDVTRRQRQVHCTTLVTLSEVRKRDAAATMIRDLSVS